MDDGRTTLLGLTCKQQYLRDSFFMKFAINLAKNAQSIGEIPVGAVLVLNDVVFSEGFNQPIKCNDPSAHAELLVLRNAAKKLRNYRLNNCELFTTLEPCTMCAGAILHARIKRLIFGAYNVKSGAAGSVINVFSMSRLNHHTLVNGGVEKEACQQLLQDFFRMKRYENHKNMK